MTHSEDIISSITQLQKRYENTLPPVDDWNPEFNGDLDMRIDREGRWFYQGGEIKRSAMVKMFSSILRREEDDYYLLTPVEKWRIQVEQAPFLMVAMRVENAGAEDQCIVLQTNVGNEVLLGRDNPLWLVESDRGEQLPMIEVRSGLPGLLSRSVFYEMVEQVAREEGGRYFVESCGEKFYLQS
ncbi:MAG: DUF1285 domain-containing protein [Cellvibrionaceae bacterium]